MHYAGTRWPASPATARATASWCPTPPPSSGTTPTTCARRSSGSAPEHVAAFFCEPVIGAGGVYPPPDGYLADVRKVCTEYDVLFVADEVVTGYGRIGGAWFASATVRPRARHDHDREGPDVGLPADGRRADRAAGVPSRSSSRMPGSGGGTATRTPDTRLPPRSRWPTSTSSSARTCSTRPPGWRATLADARWLRSPSTSGVVEVRCGTGALAAVQLGDPAAGDGAGEEAALARGRHPGGRRRRHPGLAGVRDDRRRRSASWPTRSGPPSTPDRPPGAAGPAGRIPGR